MPAVVRLLVVFLLSWQYMFHVSDSAIGVLVLFLWHFLQLVGNMSDSSEVFKEFLPKTYTGMLTLLGIEADEHKLFVACTKCDSVYDYESAFELENRKKVSRKCKFIAFPNHPYISRRIPCGIPLLKEIKCGSKAELVPWKVYPYHSLKDSITNLVQRPNFLNQCDHWRKRRELIPAETLADVTAKYGKTFWVLSVKIFCSFMVISCYL